MTMKATANVTKHVDEGTSKLTQYMSCAVLDNLEPGEVYSKLITFCLILCYTEC